MANQTVDYFRAYDFLYKHGYHGKGQNHGSKYVRKLCYAVNDFQTVLDIGCSQGIAVGKFLKKEKLAYGMDVSLNAVRQATGKKYNIPNCIQGSVTNIPFVNNFVDAIFTCDVLEHLTESDVQKAIDEIARVTRKYIFIIFDEKKEGNRDWINFGKEKFPNLFDKMPNLHLTIQPIKWWRSEIEKRGFKLKKRLQIDEKNTPPIWIFEK